ncbi:MAG: hypothetical protein NTU66_04395 [Elusimicrobia bacterium]|nr:hypothetical protein [Elusimicrobiota bacterium]
MVVKVLKILLIPLCFFLCSPRALATTTIERGDNDSWMLYVDGKPYFVKGMEYSPDRAGAYPDQPNEWMHEDKDDNGQIDAAYDSWLDENNDDFHDAHEDPVGDFQLLKNMGCNTVRIYHSDNLNVPLLRDLFDTYNVRVIMGNLLGAYTIASGAEWCEGTDYTDAKQCEKMKESVRAMVEENKDEPYLLMYMLGNENDAVGCVDNCTLNNTNAAQKPEAYAKFVNEVCVMIKKMDPHHPVGVCLATYKLLPYLARYAPAVDIVGLNAYSGPFGFGSLWHRVKTTFDRPVLITEYGTDCYYLQKKVIDEDYQAHYHRKSWQDIENNSAWGDKDRNAIGGVVYCWMDKWWLIGSPHDHDTSLGARAGANRGGVFCDEWLGICGQASGTNAPFIRQPRKAYYMYRDELWKKSLPFEPNYLAPAAVDDDNAR